MTSADILKVEFQSIKEELIQRHDELKMRASGKWAASLQEEITESANRVNVKLYGESYTKQLVDGREPGKFPPIKAIEEWIYHKGIKAVGKNISISSLAFLIARKIAKEGTKYFKQGGTDLVESVITPQRIQSIIDKVADLNMDFLIKGMVEQFKQVA